MTIERRVTFFVNAGHLFTHMFMLIFATAALVMVADFGLTYGGFLQFSLGGFIALGLGSYPAGWLGDRWSRRNMMAVFFIGIGCATVATGLVDSPWAVAATFTFVGLFAAIYHPVGTAFLVAHSDRLGRAIGVNAVFGNLGVGTAALLTGGLCDWLGWRAAFILPGLVAIAFGIAFMAFVPEAGRAAGAAKRPSLALPRTVIVRTIAVLLVVSVAGGLVFNSLTIAVPKLLDERVTLLGSSTWATGVLAAMVFTFGATSQLLAGVLVDRFPLRHVFVPMAFLQTPFLLLAAYAAELPLLLAMAAVVFAVFGQVTISDAMVARFIADEWRSRVYSLRYMVLFTVSVSALPLVGLLHDHYSFAVTLVVLAALGFVVFLAALATPLRTEERQALRPPALRPAE